MDIENEALNHLLSASAGGGAVLILGKIMVQRALSVIHDMHTKLHEVLVHMAEMRTQMSSHIKFVDNFNDSLEKLENGVHHIEKEVVNLKVRLDHFEKRRDTKANSK